MQKFVNTVFLAASMFLFGVFAEKEFGLIAITKDGMKSTKSCCSGKLVPIPFENLNKSCSCKDCWNGGCCSSCFTGTKCVCVNCECCPSCNGKKTKEL